MALCLCVHEYVSCGDIAPRGAGAALLGTGLRGRQQEQPHAVMWGDVMGDVCFCEGDVARDVRVQRRSMAMKTLWHAWLQRCALSDELRAISSAS